MTDRIGQTLGNYRLTHLLGQGGFAEVYLGVHMHLGTQAAIKLLHTLLATPGEMEQFRQEARIVAALVHPHIVRVLDFDVSQGTPYLVLDYAPNGSLRQRLPAGTPHDPRVVLPYLMQVADGLQHAHDQKLIHRDIKPENMLLGRQNEVLLGDFGIAVVAQNSTLQKTQGIAGTTAYMAPEQLQGKPRLSSDIYSLGVVVYEWLTGERPFQGAPMEVASQHVLTPPPPLREKVPTIPPALEQVVLTALAKDPKDRFGSARAFANAFSQACGSPVTFSTLSTLSQATQGQPAFPQSSQGASDIHSATTHVTPHLTPQFSNPTPAALAGQTTPSVHNAPTQVTPLPFTTSQATAGSMTSPTAANTGAQVTPGWANQIAPAAGGAGSPPPLDTWAPPAGSPAAPATPQAAPRKGGTRRWVLLAAACLIVLAAIGGSVSAFTHFFGKNTAQGPTATNTARGPTAANAATVTITPQSSDLKDTFTIAAVTGTPDTSKEVQARQVSVTTQAVSQTVNATGQGTTPGKHAVGTVKVSNSDPANPVNFPAGASFPNNGGCSNYSSIVLVLDTAVSLPAGSGTTTAPAHVKQVGTGGNFPLKVTCNTPLSVITFNWNNGVDCGGIHCVQMSDASDFTGGTDPQTYTAVAQSDIDNAANNLISQNQPNAQQVLQGQLQSGEQLIGTSQCSPNVSANHQAGAQASTVTVSVTFTCSGEAYDQAGSLTLAKTLLTSEAQSKLGAGYALAGQIKTDQVNATQDSQGNVTITDSAEGIWAYQFSDAQKTQLASLIIGKTKADATQLLSAQAGIAQVTITLPSSMGNLLPTDTKEIMVVIQPVTGL
jgi:serine/threonine protein kinase